MQPDTATLIERGKRHNSPTYAPANIVLDHGEGVWLVDREGRRYLDFMAGIAVNILGHNHPRLNEALIQQAQRLWHTSNLFYTAEQIELLTLLCERSFADRAFLCNSGAEANEAALKLARRYQTKVAHKPHKTGIITMHHSFHGRTLAAVTATGQPKYHEGFAPLVQGFSYASFNELDSVRALAGEDTAAILVEPVQGEGGVRPATREFLEGLRQLCDDIGALLIFDEVQCGVARTGELFGYQHYGVVPDIMTLAKGLGGGIPIGAMLATERVFQGFERGSHASTFGGNPLASAVACAVLEVIEQEHIGQNARQMGERLMAGLRVLQAKYPVITDVRGLGLMVGAECEGSAAARIAQLALEEGLIINTAGGNTLRFVPPLVVSAGDVDEAIVRLERALAAWSGEAA